MSYCEIAYDGRYSVLLRWSPFTIWCVNAACFLGEGTEDERRIPQKNIEQSSQSEQILIIAIWQSLNKDDEKADSEYMLHSPLATQPVKWELFPQPTPSKDYSLNFWNNMEGANVFMLINYCLLNSYQ